MSTIEPTVIAGHTFIKGEVHLSGPTVIGGRVEGKIIAEDALEIAPDAIVEGDIEGVLVDIQGKVKGNVTANQSCRLGATAKLTGELRTANLAIAEGASFIGQVWVGAQDQSEEASPSIGIDRATVAAATTSLPAAPRMDGIAGTPASTAHVASIAAPAPDAQTNGVAVLPQALQNSMQRGPRIVKVR